MMEILMSMKKLESHANKESVNEYLRNINHCDGPTVLETFVDKLPKTERRIVRLKFWKKMNHDEIAHAMRLNLSQVNEILERAISLLRHKMITTLVDLEPDFELEENTSLVG